MENYKLTKKRKIMSPLVISFPTIFFFTSSIIILISTSISPVQCRNPNIAPILPSPNPSMLKSACSGSALIDRNECLRVLRSIPKVASAKDPRHLLIAIIESGISNMTNTNKHIEAEFDKTNATQPKVKDALKYCKEAYNEVVDRFGNALQGVENYDYHLPSYELLTASTDYVKICDGALAKQRVKDEVISRGNKVVPIFGLSAFWIVNKLDDQTTVAPPPSA